MIGYCIFVAVCAVWRVKEVDWNIFSEHIWWWIGSHLSHGEKSCRGIKLVNNLSDISTSNWIRNGVLGFVNVMQNLYLNPKSFWWVILHICHELSLVVTPFCCTITKIDDQQWIWNDWLSQFDGADERRNVWSHGPKMTICFMCCWCCALLLLLKST